MEIEKEACQGTSKCENMEFVGCMVDIASSCVLASTKPLSFLYLSYERPNGGHGNRLCGLVDP